MIYTIAEAGTALNLTRQRIHQLIRELGIQPKTIRAGRVAVLILSASDLRKMRGRRLKSPGRPKTKPVE